MKKTFMLLSAGVCLAIQTNAQILDTLAELEAGANIVDLAVKGGRIFATAGAKVYSSTDASSWTATAAVPDFIPYDEKPRHMLVTSDGSLYVAVNAYVGAAPIGAGIMKSTDNGGSWQTFSAFDMGGGEETGRIIELSGGRILTYASVGNKNYHSTLSGTTWTKSNEALLLYEATKYGDTLVASTTSGMRYSVDMGDTWTALPLPSSTNMGRFGSVVFHNTSQHRFGGSWQNVSRAATASINFSDLAPNLASETPSYYPKQIISDGDEHLFMTYTDAAGNCYIEKSTDDGMTWTLLKKFASTACFTRIVVFGDDIIGAVGSKIVRLANVATPLPSTSVAQNGSQQNKMRLSPNPAGSYLYINDFSGTVMIYSVAGACYRQAMIKGAETLDISDLVPGMYFITGIANDGSYQQQRFIKQ